MSAFNREHRYIYKTARAISVLAIRLADADEDAAKELTDSIEDQLERIKAILRECSSIHPPIED